MTCDSDHIICGLLNKELAVFDRKSLNLVQNLSGHTDHIWSIDMTEKLIISGSWDSTVKLWSKKDWKILDSYSHPDQKEISGVKFSLSDNFVYVSCLSGALTILKLEEQQRYDIQVVIIGQIHLPLMDGPSLKFVIKIFFFHLNPMKIGEVVVTNFTKFH